MLAHVPYVDNAALYRLLGPSTYRPSEETSTGEDEDELGRVEGKPARSITVAVPMAQPSKPVPAQQGNEQGAAIPLSLDKIITLFEQGKISETALLALMGKLPVVSAEEGGDEEPGQEQEQQVETEQLPDGVVAFPPSRRSVATLPVDLQQAYDRYEEGLSRIKYAQRLGVSKATAGHIIQRLKDKGALDSTGRKLSG